jgi:hypothetical protein
LHNTHTGRPPGSHRRQQRQNIRTDRRSVPGFGVFYGDAAVYVFFYVYLTWRPPLRMQRASMVNEWAMNSLACIHFEKAAHATHSRKMIIIKCRPVTNG